LAATYKSTQVRSSRFETSGDMTSPIYSGYMATQSLRWKAA